jgi:hypothetical protein
MKKTTVLLLSLFLLMTVMGTYAQGVNEWTKENSKESFEEKLARYKENGFKVAVSITVIDTIRAKKISSSQSSYGYGSLPNAQSDFTVFEEKELFEQLAAEVMAHMQSQFNSDVFELIDRNTIENKSLGYGEYRRDFWSTDYKTNVHVRIYPHYNGNVHHQEDKITVSANYYISGDLFITEYFEKKGKQKSKSLTGIEPIAFKTYGGEKISEDYPSSSQPGLVKIDELIERKHGQELYDEFMLGFDKVKESINKKLVK